ncbi:MAG: PSD1 and planctomycete cytochrome C domain-containing protein, partial [Thermoguttaceae bacterium]
FAAAEPVDFSHQVLPILKNRCSECHTAGTYEGGVSLDTREALLGSSAAVPGNSAESQLIRRVTSADPDVRMPPEGDPLAPADVAVLRRWIDEGLPWQSGFSFKPGGYEPPLEPRRPPLPPPLSGRNNPVDRIIDAYYRANRIGPPKPIDDAAWFRRASLDLVGLLPRPDPLAAFVADPSPDKRRQLARRLLDDKRAYSDHWLTFWNDLLRNDYQGTGYIDGGRKQITGWLYQSLWDNKPYDQFVRELLSPTPDSEGFIRGIKWRGNVNASQTPELQFAQTTSQVFLGINMKCASCHDSFIDNWKLADAYGLAAIMAEQPLEIYRCDKPTGDLARPAFVFPQLGAIDPSLPPAQRLGQYASLMTDPGNGRFARTIVNRLWQRLMGRGIVEPVDMMQNQPWSEDLLDYLAVHLADHGYDLKKTLLLIVTSEAYQAESTVSSEAPDGADFVFRGPAPRRMTAEQYLDAVWSITDTAPEEPVAKIPPSDRDVAMVRASLVNADSLLRSLGRAPREQVVTTRPAELDTLQALQLSNGEILAGLLARGADNLRRQHPNWPADEATDWIYRHALGREPSPAEVAVARPLLGEPVTAEGLADLLWVVLMLPEFQLIR